MLISAEYENSTAHAMCKCFEESVRITTLSDKDFLQTNILSDVVHVCVLNANNCWHFNTYEQTQLS